MSDAGLYTLIGLLISLILGILTYRGQIGGTKASRENTLVTGQNAFIDQLQEERDRLQLQVNELRTQLLEAQMLIAEQGGVISRGGLS